MLSALALGLADNTHLDFTDITKTSLFHRWGEWQNDEQEWQNMEYSNIRNVLKHGIYRIF